MNSWQPLEVQDFWLLLICPDNSGLFWVRPCFFKLPHPLMAVQAFAVVIRNVEFDFIECRNGSGLLNPQMAQAADLGVHGAKHGVVGVAGLFTRHQMFW